jgi:hypothetical protein
MALALIEPIFFVVVLCAKSAQKYTLRRKPQKDRTAMDPSLRPDSECLLNFLELRKADVQLWRIFIPRSRVNGPPTEQYVIVPTRHQDCVNHRILAK